MLNVIIALLIFGFLILIHELGHYTMARVFKVGINEFSVGMGPKVVSKKSKKTGIAYSLRLLPIGGFVSMDGEDEDSGSENSLSSKPVWQRFFIMVAGAVMNILVGIVLTCVIVCRSQALGSTVVASFSENASSQTAGLAEGDRIVKIGKHGVHTSYDLSYIIMHSATEKTDITVIRGGETVVIPGVEFKTETESGVTVAMRDFRVKAERKSFGNVVKHSFWQSLTSVRMIWDSLIDLVTGKYGVDALSGPIGITGEIGNAVAAHDGGMNLMYLTALIALNLGIFNLLPFPALDGGQIVLLIVELIIRKPVKREIAGYINFVGLALLMLLMLFVTYQDITRLIKK
ncbi:MAG: M50 family metallopeptidase [Firmicutes bacterium]|nr:M50 family metallopeptidase [Bacillota bacterium]MDY2905744.1 M50 family metallopeptidase [Eubacteriales bacterium]